MKLRGVYKGVRLGLLMGPKSRLQGLPPGSHKPELAPEPEPPLLDRPPPPAGMALMPILLPVPGRDSCCALGLLTAASGAVCECA